MADIEDYKKRLDEQTEDYYNMARQQEYSALYNKEVALENAKANAMKYANNAINARGFGGTGYGSSLQAGMYNNYLNRWNEANTNYNKNINQYNLDEKQAYINNADKAEERDNDRFANITTQIQDDRLKQSDIDAYLERMGVGEVVDGKFVFNEQKPEGISDDNWNGLYAQYVARANELADEEDVVPEKTISETQKTLNELGLQESDGRTFRELLLHLDNLNVEGHEVMKYDKENFMEYLSKAKDGDVVKETDQSSANGKVRERFYIVYNNKLYEVDDLAVKGKKVAYNIVLNPAD